MVLVTMCHHDFGVDWTRTDEETDTDAEDSETSPTFANESSETEVELLTDGGDE